MEQIDRPRSWIEGAVAVAMGTVLIASWAGSAFNGYVVQMLALSVLFLGMYSARQAVQIKALVELLRDESKKK